MNNKQLISELRIFKKDHKRLSAELKSAHDYLNNLKIPTNGVDAENNPGFGKRQTLSLKQRLSFIKPNYKLIKYHIYFH